MKAIEDFKKFIKNISKEDKLVLAYDKDGDGVSAVTIAKTALNRIGLESETFPFDRAHIQEFVNHLENEHAEHVIVFDISAEQYPEIFRQLPKTKFLIIDHHKKYGSPKGVLIIKPNDICNEKDPGRHPAAKLSYTLFSKIAKISDLDWVSSVGIISDSSYEKWKRFVNGAIKKQGWAVTEDIFQSVPGKIAALINASNSIKESRITEALDLMLTLDPQKVLKSDLAKLAKDIQKEIDKAVNDYEKKGEFMFDRKLIIFEFSPKYKVGGFASNPISQLNRKSFVLVVSHTNGWAKLSARCQEGGIPANDVLERATAGLRDAKAGGHKPAAGGIVHREDFPEFKKRFIAEIKKYIK